jgi:hypothetical protein
MPVVGAPCMEVAADWLELGHIRVVSCMVSQTVPTHLARCTACWLLSCREVAANN